jgi:hypothetical protein
MNDPDACHPTLPSRRNYCVSPPPRQRDGWAYLRGARGNGAVRRRPVRRAGGPPSDRSATRIAAGFDPGGGIGHNAIPRRSAVPLDIGHLAGARAMDAVAAFA